MIEPVHLKTEASDQGVIQVAFPAAGLAITIGSMAHDNALTCVTTLRPFTFPTPV